MSEGHTGWIARSILAVLIAVSCSAKPSGDDKTNGVSEPVVLPKLRKLEFGRDFLLTDQNGASFDSATLRGDLIFLFFGYTTCPDACPMTLSKLARVNALLGDDGQHVRTVYVSVDPERDTVDTMREYLSYYTLSVVGLTGSAEEIKSVAADFGVYYSKSEEETAVGYLVDHTTLVYVIDQEGTLRYLSHPEDSSELLAGVARKILAE